MFTCGRKISLDLPKLLFEGDILSPSNKIPLGERIFEGDWFRRGGVIFVEGAKTLSVPQESIKLKYPNPARAIFSFFLEHGCEYED